jgi:hypothetical protein
MGEGRQPQHLKRIRRGVIVALAAASGLLCAVTLCASYRARGGMPCTYHAGSAGSSPLPPFPLPAYREKEKSPHAIALEFTPGAIASSLADNSH